ncbi:MAG: hypothetical protein KF767_09350 [Bdellovibrionaceae bacterium]|nr:hypothetical protein [Pseudobdellovibrionaceae bacterium]
MGHWFFVMMTMAFAIWIQSPATAFAQAVGGKGSGGGGLLAANATKAPRYGCEEGRRQGVTFPDASGEQVLQVRTCRNGSYMTDEERAAYIYNPKTRCREGRLETWTEHNASPSERIRYKRMVCRGGRWVERP